MLETLQTGHTCTHVYDCVCVCVCVCVFIFIYKLIHKQVKRDMCQSLTDTHPTKNQHKTATATCRRDTTKSFTSLENTRIH